MSTQNTPRQPGEPSNNKPPAQEAPAASTPVKKPVRSEPAPKE